MKDIGDFCFDVNSVDYAKIEIENKPIYIFANHATAIRAWFEQSKNSPLNLVTFDEHLDTRPPLFNYGTMHLNNSKDEILSLLDKLRENISDNILRNLLFSQGWLTAQIDSWEDPNHSWCKLNNDEHITTAMYLGIIKKSFICSHSSTPLIEKENEKLSLLYNEVYYLNKAYTQSCTALEQDENETKERFFYELNKRNIFDERIKSLYWAGLETEHPFILDIDLDYFYDISVLDNDLHSYKLFGKLIKNAICITIATEPSCVYTATSEYNRFVDEFNAKNKAKKRLSKYVWDSKDVLLRLMKIIEFWIKKH